MKRALIFLSVCLMARADVTSYDKPMPVNFQLKTYKQILPQAVPTSLTTVVTQATGCTSAAGGSATTMGTGCGVYIDSIVISCPAGSAGTLLVQDLQSSPIAVVPTITVAANTLYSLSFAWYWAPGVFKIQQVTGSGCTYTASWGTR